MGKPYASELELLPETYMWAMRTCVRPLAEALAASAPLPLLACGSGGSLTGAHFASQLHQRYAGRLAKAVTPFELISSTSVLKETSVLILSAGGRNSDIIGAFKQIASREPQQFTVVCSRTNSPLSQLAKSYGYVGLVEFDLPTGRDGFLATNSLLAFTTMLCRAWATAFSIQVDLASDLDSLLCLNASLDAFLADLANRCSPLWGRETISVLYGPSAHAAAIDLESKFTEAALGTIQVADYRNFAHGRHHWLAKRGGTSGVLAFVTEDDRVIADKTLRLLPPNIPVVRIDIGFSGPRASLASLVTVLHLVGFAGKARGIDPGRPGVPPFGGKIYRLSGLGPSNKHLNSLSPIEAAAIERKTRTSIRALSDRGELDFWKKAHWRFTNRLQTDSYGAVVFDYDGTLCEPSDRYKGLRKEVVEQLVRVLESGSAVGIATGRGGSVRTIFRSIIPRALWERVCIGYYNGSDNGLLSEDSHPDSTEGCCDKLLPVLLAIKSHATKGRLSEYISEVTCRQWQITVQLKSFTPPGLVWDAVQQAVRRLNIHGIEVLFSSHSVDVIAPGVSKQTIVDQARKMIHDPNSTAVLRIGDRGQWPGNDFILLSSPHSLSVDAVSSDPETCWNVASPGYRGVQATLQYLKSLQLRDGLLTFGFATRGEG